MSENFDLIRAQAHLHQQYFICLQLMVSTRDGPEAIRDWMFRLFREQHETKFLSSFKKLVLEGLPDAVASAQYHVLSNMSGSVGVEYMPDLTRRPGYVTVTPSGGWTVRRCVGFLLQRATALCVAGTQIMGHHLLIHGSDLYVCRKI